MEAFWCITLSIIVLRKWWKHQFPKRPTVHVVKSSEPKQPLDLQRERDIADLKRQGYTDELIATILPVVNS